MRILWIAMGWAVANFAMASSFTSYGPIYARHKQSLEQGGGCISGSIGTTLPGKHAQTIVYFATEANADSNFKLAHFAYAMDKKNDIADGQLRANVFRMCLKPGKYQLFGVSVTGTVSTERVRVPFVVEPGRETYLGSFVFHNTSSNRGRCSNAASWLYVEVKDESVRDLPLIMNREKSMGTAPAVEVVDTSAGAPYFVTCMD